MIYVKYIAVLAISILAFAYLLWYLRRIRRDHFQKLSIEKLLAQEEASRTKLYLNTRVLRQIISALLAKKDKKSRRALLNLACGRISAFKAFLNKNSKLSALSNILFPEKIEELPPAEKAVWFLSQNQIKEAEKIIENLADKGLQSYAEARKRFVQGWLFLRDGDMLSASQCAAEAATLFAEQKAFVEEAQALLLNGTIYRLSCVEDVALMMFDSAAKIFRLYKDSQGEAETLGNKGMLWVLQEKFEEAEKDFEQALKLCPIDKNQILTISILNQQALLKILSGQYKPANKILKQSEKLSKQRNYISGLAFSSELSAHLLYADNKKAEAAKTAKKAAELYQQDNNMSAYYESLYLQALALFEAEKTDDAEKILRGLISQAKGMQTSFHLAGAYNLMGLIFWRREKIKQAKVWFQEAAALEQKNDRYTGAATDYADIGLLEFQKGNLEEARKNFKTALEYADIYGKNKLSEILKAKMSELKI